MQINQDHLLHHYLNRKPQEKTKLLQLFLKLSGTSSQSNPLEPGKQEASDLANASTLPSLRPSPIRRAGKPI